jgi:hypothetical protein
METDDHLSYSIESNSRPPLIGLRAWPGALWRAADYLPEQGA